MKSYCLDMFDDTYDILLWDKIVLLQVSSPVYWNSAELFDPWDVWL